MLYLFSDFMLDTEKKELSYNNEVVVITKQNYNLLLYFLKNPNTSIDKDQLIQEVWKGRSVADNTVDQSIYKVRKILLEKKEADYFETVYGLGVKFLPEVKVQEANNEENISNTKKPTKKTFFWIIPITLLLIASAILLIYNSSYQEKELTPEKNKYNSLLLVLPNGISKDKNLWYKNSSSPVIEKLLSLSQSISMKYYNDKPDNIEKEDFLENQWKLYPELKVISTDVTLSNNLFEVTLSIVNKQQNISKKTFINQNFNQAFIQGKTWLNQQITNTNNLSKLDNNTLNNPYLLEMYMRGLSAVVNKKIDQAINFFEICIKEDPDFYMGTYELIKLLERTGNQQRALALIDVLLSSNKNPILNIQARSLRGGIFLRQGKPEKAKETFLEILNQHKDKNYVNLLAVRYKLSSVYRSLSENDLALKEINKVEKLLETVKNFQTLAEVYQYKGSLLLRIGETNKAKIYMEKAMKMFVKTDDLFNMAKTHSGIARLLIQQSDYNSALDHLKKSLDIVKGLGNDFGIGATLNEIIRVEIAIGQIEHARELNLDLEKIAGKLDFNAMLLASKLHNINISLIQNKWQQTRIYLEEHLNLAKAANNQRALLENKFMSLELNLTLKEKNKPTNNILETIKNIQNYIDESKEFRLQPQLNVLTSRNHFLNKETQKALSLLLSSLELANKTQDGESVIAINNLLAEIYLDQNLAQKALSTLEKSSQFNPVAYPFLLLKSKAYAQLNQINKALESASSCKRQANELWQIDDEKYYSTLVNSEA